MVKRYKKKIDLWQTDITLFLCDDITVLNCMFEDLGMNPKDHAVTFIRKGKLYICISTNHTNPGTIAHEAKHAVNMIFDAKGVRLDVNNDEAECYLLGHIVEWIHKTVQQWKK